MAGLSSARASSKSDSSRDGRTVRTASFFLWPTPQTQCVCVSIPIHPVVDQRVHLLSCYNFIIRPGNSRSPSEWDYLVVAKEKKRLHHHGQSSSSNRRIKGDTTVAYLYVDSLLLNR